MRFARNRGEVAKMYASLSTWQLDEAIQDDATYHAFVRDVLRRTLPTMRDIGILDSMIVRTAPDTIVSVTVYESEDAAKAAWIEASGPMRRLYEARLTFVSRLIGPADDMPQLTDAGRA
jgi:hypothetical protein